MIKEGWRPVGESPFRTKPLVTLRFFDRTQVRPQQGPQHWPRFGTVNCKRTEDAIAATRSWCACGTASPRLRRSTPGMVCRLTDLFAGFSTRPPLYLRPERRADNLAAPTLCRLTRSALFICCSPTRPKRLEVTRDAGARSVTKKRIVNYFRQVSIRAILILSRPVPLTVRAAGTGARWNERPSRTCDLRATKLAYHSPQVPRSSGTLKLGFKWLLEYVHLLFEAG